MSRASKGVRTAGDTALRQPEPIANLSAALITYNEAARIDECLASLEQLCGEIVVLDSNSTDATREICERRPQLRFVQREFAGYSEQKNRALDLCTREWILCLDADERLTPEAADNIRRFINHSPPPEIAGARLIRRTVHMGTFINHGGWTHYRYRLVRRGRARWRGVDDMPLHELLHPIAATGVGESNAPRFTEWHRQNGVTLNGDLIHSSQTDLANQVDTINTYSSIYAGARHARRLRALQKRQRGRTPRRPFYLWRMLWKPPIKFIEIYIAKAGFLDGYRGLIIAVSSSFATFLRWAKMYELSRTDLREASNLPQFLRADSNANAPDGDAQLQDSSRP